QPLTTSRKQQPMWVASRRGTRGPSRAPGWAAVIDSKVKGGADVLATCSADEADRPRSPRSHRPFLGRDRRAAVLGLQDRLPGAQPVAEPAAGLADLVRRCVFATPASEGRAGAQGPLAFSRPLACGRFPGVP